MLALPVFDVPRTRPASRVWSVGGLVAAVAGLIEQNISACVVSGEISGLSRASSGHSYFTLKDSTGAATLRCVMFRRAVSMLDFEPADGQQVEVRGRISIYEPRGELQFVAEAMQRSGAGALYERFVRLRATLEAEGLFDALLKRPLPSFPLTVGVVTSLGGAALHDVATTFARRSPHLRVVVYPSVVQGADAPRCVVRRDCSGESAWRGRRADCLSRRRIARGSLGVQTTSASSAPFEPRRCRW